MKKIKFLSRALMLAVVVIVASCDVTELDLADNPNALSPDQASPDFFLNAIQVDFARSIVEPFGRTGAQLTRIDYMSGRDYTNAYSPASQDGRWQSAYQRMMMDIETMYKLTTGDAGLTKHTGMAQVMQAYTLMTLVDFYGDVPYSEAFAGEDGNLNPGVDNGADIYAAAIGLLDAAIANFEADALAEPQYDFYYDGDWGKWIKAANTIKMKAYMTTRLVDASAVASFNTIVAGGNYITSNADDMQFRYGTNEIQPDTRHSRYASTYTATGGGRYTSNSLMYYMQGNNPELGSFNPSRYDPRILFYFYRQVSGTPGIDAPADEEVLECGLQNAPIHYDGYVFCGAPQGYWGRDHGNDNGIPPDGFLRTLEGVYPAGGALDDFSFDAQINGGGNGGAGVTPVMLASWAQFMIAETQMVAGDVAGAKASMDAGIALSMDKVTNFFPRTARFEWIFGTGANPSDPTSNGPILGLLSDYIGAFNSDLTAEWDAAGTAGKWDILGMQYYVAMYGNGIDAYNFYRRTGYPTTLQPNIEPDPGGFIRSFYYAANAANTNQNITQKSGVDVQVFWDTNPASPGFPAAN
ncbi:MAG: SusD/RagB family nutrient-binding outer membrane lipoprotein [Cyclobacteriaceae bacterium]